MFVSRQIKFVVFLFKIGMLYGGKFYNIKYVLVL